MNTKLLNLPLSSLSLAAGLALTSCSTPTPAPGPQSASAAAVKEGVPGGVFVNTLETSARVTAVDQTTRKVTLMDADGKQFTVKAGPEAVNFDQVKVGDLVKATLTEELVVSLGDAASASQDTAAGLVALAPKGAQPGGVAAQTTRVTGTVIELDRTRRTARLRFEDGSSKTFPVRSDVNLANRHIGEKVVFRITEMIALNLEKP
jgi:hypothetical protein